LRFVTLSETPPEEDKATPEGPLAVRVMVKESGELVETDVALTVTPAAHGTLTLLGEAA